MARSVQTVLMSTSMTPRSAQDYLAYLATLPNPSSDEILYTSAKLALGEGDTAAARTLLDQCPREYRRVKRYTKQLDTYDALCTRGLIERRDSLDVCAFLADVLGEDASNPDVVRYADALRRHGYNLRSLNALTLASAERCMERAAMTDGHRCLFEEAVARNTPCGEYAFMTMLRALERCAGVATCLKQHVPKDVSRKVLAKALETKDDEENEGATGDVEDEEETAGDS